MSSSLRPTLYQAIISLLNQSEDLVVRIEAAMTLKTDILYYQFIFFVTITDSYCFLQKCYEIHVNQFVLLLYTIYSLLIS